MELKKALINGKHQADYAYAVRDSLPREINNICRDILVKYPELDGYSICFWYRITWGTYRFTLNLRNKELDLGYTGTITSTYCDLSTNNLKWVLKHWKNIVRGLYAESGRIVKQREKDNKFFKRMYEKLFTAVSFVVFWW